MGGWPNTRRRRCSTVQPWPRCDSKGSPRRSGRARTRCTPSTTSRSTSPTTSSWCCSVRPGCGKSTLLRMVAGLEDPTHRRRLHRRPAGQRRRAEGARRGDGLPELRAVPAQDRAGEHRVPAQGPRRQPLRAGRAGQGGRRVARPRRAARPQARPAERRPAPARRPRPGDRAPPGRVLHGRAAVQPRRQAARRDPRRARRAARPAGQHVHLRHPRPGRGDDDGLADRGDERRQAAAGRHAAPRSTTGRRRRSSPSSSAHRR